MFRGSPGLSADQLAAIIAAMGGEFNADTQQTVTQYLLTVPSADLDVALHIEAIRMRGVLDTEKTVGAGKGGHRTGGCPGLLESRVHLLHEAARGHVQGDALRAKVRLGAVASFDKTTGAMLKKFHETWYAPNNAVLVIVGDVEPQKALARGEEVFRAIFLRKKIPPRPEIHLEPVKPETIRPQDGRILRVGHNSLSPARL